MSGSKLRTILNYILLYLAVGAGLAWVYFSIVRAHPGPVNEVQVDWGTVGLLLGLALW